nr:GGDEF domain-containing protein [Candidatus Omnitrophota bacterium]
VLLGICVVAWIVFSVMFRRFCQTESDEKFRKLEEGRLDLEAMKEKYQVRVENLNRLEKQVLSLMEIFEIARDFSGALKMEVLCRLIYERVLPELPFKRLRFILADEGADSIICERYFLINSSGVEDLPADFSEEERGLYEQVFRKKLFLKTLLSTGPDGLGQEEERWIFPLTVESKIAGLVVVEGAHTDDFVKFEVFVSQLVLQVRKIKLYETVLQLSIIDGLTGVYVRRYFMERMSEEVKRSLKLNRPLSVLMLDIDHFKRYNDQFGHLAGDETLKKVAAIIRASMRKVDIVARYGGEEFVAVLPESSSSTAHEVAERIRSSVARHDFKIYDSQSKVTVSIGISTFPEDIFPDGQTSFYDDLAFDLIRHADKALYRAKEEGRNRVFQYRDISTKNA